MGEQINIKDMSKEELESAVSRLSYQLDASRKKMEQMGSILTRLPFLFEIVKLGEKTFSKEFVTSCAKEIEEVITIPEKENSENGEAQ